MRRRPPNRETGLRRAVAALEALRDAGEAGGMRVGEVAAALGRDRSLVSRSLRDLAAAGLVDRDAATRRYRLGWRLRTAAERAAGPRLAAAAPAVLRRLAAEVGETASLCVLRDRAAATLLFETPSSSVAAADWAGRAVPLSCSAAGRALLAGLEPEERAALLAGTALPRPTPAAPADLAALERRLAAEARRGVAVADEELAPGLTAAAAPVLDASGRAAAAVVVSGPAERLRPRLRGAAARVRAAAAELGAEIAGG